MTAFSCTNFLSEPVSKVVILRGAFLFAFADSTTHAYLSATKRHTNNESEPLAAGMAHPAPLTAEVIRAGPGHRPRASNRLSPSAARSQPTLSRRLVNTALPAGRQRAATFTAAETAMLREDR